MGIDGFNARFILYNVITAKLLVFFQIMGKPKLPSKSEMNNFLQKFKPKSIKKHRTIHNLLFIGFMEKSSFDAIVNADGTVIGKFNYLSISTKSFRV